MSEMPLPGLNILVAGWFSFRTGHATGGDLLVLDVTCRYLDKAGYKYEIASVLPLQQGKDWRNLNPKEYTHVIFVCGPFEQGESELDFLTRFNHCRLIGLNLSMLVPTSEWNPFDLLIERDSSTAVRPDMAFLSTPPKVPIVGVCLVESYPGGLSRLGNEAIQHLINTNNMAIVRIDTRMDFNLTGLRNPAELDSLIAHMDVVLTTRLHGAVLALKNGVPVLPIDPAPGGGKIVQQMKRVGWPLVFNADAINPEDLQAGYEYCLSEEARMKSRDCYNYAKQSVEETLDQFIIEMGKPGIIESNYHKRISDPLSSDPFSKYPNFSQIIQYRERLEKQQRSWQGKMKKPLKKVLRFIAYWTFPIPLLRFTKRMFFHRRLL